MNTLTTISKHSANIRTIPTWGVMWAEVWRSFANIRTIPTFNFVDFSVIYDVQIEHCTS